MSTARRAYRPRPLPRAGAGRRARLRRPLPAAVRDSPRWRSTRRAARARPAGRPCDVGADFVDDPDDATSPRSGRSSASSSPTTSPPTARRSAIAPSPARSATSAPRGPTSRASTAPARSARRTCTSKDDPAKLLLGAGGQRRAAQPRGHRADRRSAQRRAPVHEPDAGRVHQAAQPAGRPAARRRRRRGGRLRGGAAGGHLALPARDPARVPARPDRRASSPPSCSTAARSCTAPDDDPYIPFEFADAAYRYGHAQIRDRYQVNARLRPVPGVPRPDGLRPGPARARRRLDAADRRRGPRAGAARQAHRRAPARAR